MSTHSGFGAAFRRFVSATGFILPGVQPIGTVGATDGPGRCAVTPGQDCRLYTSKGRLLRLVPLKADEFRASLAPYSEQL